MSSPIKLPLPASTLMEQLERDAPEVAEALKNLHHDPRDNFRDDKYAKKWPERSGRYGTL